MKKIWLSLLLLAFIFRVNAQQPQQILKDANSLLQYFKNGKLDPDKESLWLPILQKYAPSTATTPDEVIASFDGNPFGLADGGIIVKPVNKAMFAMKSSSKLRMEAITLEGPADATGTAPAGSGGLSTASITNDLVNLIIERGKEELSASFFAQMKKWLQANPELQIAFPKTSQFIGNIESYLYASYLQTLREAFISDINDLPLHTGAILNTSRIKDYLKKNVKSNAVWAIVPTLTFIGDLRDSKSLPDAVKDLMPDDALSSSDKNTYNFLRFSVFLSEAARDPNNVNQYISAADLTAFLNNATNQNVFFGLLYQEIKTLDLVQPIMKPAQINQLKTLAASFSSGYGDVNDLIATISAAVKSGAGLTFAQVLDLINKSSTDLQGTLAALNLALKTAGYPQINADAAFTAIPKIAEAVGDFNNQKYAAGVMTTLLIINTYVAPQTQDIQPFINKTELDPTKINSANAEEALALAAVVVGQYDSQYPSDGFKKYAKKLNKLASQIKGTASTDQLKDATDLLKKVQNYNYSFDGQGIYQQLLKYGTLMAALAEAKDDAGVTAALDAAILPVGSSSIKSNTICSFSLNSYIGGAYYQAAYYQRGSGSYSIHTAGVALPIGPNFSLGLRNNWVGAVSIFASVVDLGAVASYRLSSPSNSTTQTLPDFSFQNLLAPGGFIVLNRLFNSPLAVGFGVQRAPQLSSINNGSADLTVNPQWRMGAFLTLDIPLFNLYSKALKRPLNGN